MEAKELLKICKKCLCHSCQEFACKEFACTNCDLETPREKCLGYKGREERRMEVRNEKGK